MSLTNKVPEKDVQRTFNNIAGNYDRLNTIMSLGTHQSWRQKATQKINNQPQDILDLCCGTADWTVMLAHRFIHAKVIGVDFSQEMLKLAQQKVAKSKVTNITLESGNAMKLNFRTIVLMS